MRAGDDRGVGPTVSIILPTYDRMPYLRFAVDSVRAQTFGDWELIVVDDGSTDATAAYLGSIRDRRLRHLRIEHTGLPARARNVGLTRARGEYVAFLDSDDTWHPRKLERQMEALRAEPDAGWSYTDVNFVDAHSALLPRDRFVETHPRSGMIVERLLAHETVIACPTVVAERRLVEDVGGFDESLPLSEDFDLWLRLAIRAPAVALRERLVDYRQHRSYSRGRPEMAACMIRIHDRFARSTRVRRWRRVSRRQRAMYRIRLANLLLRRGEHARALNALCRAFVHRPHDSALWKAVVRLALTTRLLRRLGRVAAPLLRPIAGRESPFWRVIRSPRLRHLAFRDPVDCIVYALLISGREIRFVQIGSNDGRRGDPLWRFRRYANWHGLLVEPVESVFARLRTNYEPWSDRFDFEKAAVAATSGWRTLYRIETDGSAALAVDQLGTLRRRLVERHLRRLPIDDARVTESRVRSLTFHDLHERHGLTRVDLLHIDAEGAECEILRHVDFARMRPALVLYEHVHLTPGEKARARRILVRAGYDTVEKGDDTIAVHRPARTSLRPLRSAWRRVA